MKHDDLKGMNTISSLAPGWTEQDLLCNFQNIYQEIFPRDHNFKQLELPHSLCA